MYARRVRVLGVSKFHLAPGTISTMTGREFGFGHRKLTEEELVHINASRAGTYYSDQASDI